MLKLFQLCLPALWADANYDIHISRARFKYDYKNRVWKTPMYLHGKNVFFDSSRLPANHRKADVIVNESYRLPAIKFFVNLETYLNRKLSVHL